MVLFFLAIFVYLSGFGDLSDFGVFSGFGNLEGVLHDRGQYFCSPGFVNCYENKDGVTLFFGLTINPNVFWYTFSTGYFRITVKSKTRSIRPLFHLN